MLQHSIFNCEDNLDLGGYISPQDRKHTLGVWGPFLLDPYRCSENILKTLTCIATDRVFSLGYKRIIKGTAEEVNGPIALLIGILVWHAPERWVGLMHQKCISLLRAILLTGWLLS